MKQACTSANAYGAPGYVKGRVLAEPAPEEMPRRSRVVIIGAGITGCSIARELSSHIDDIVIIDKEADVACGTTKANNAEIHSGIGEKAGTLKQRLNVRGNELYDRFVDGLNVDFVRQGLLIVITPRTLPANAARFIPRKVFAYLLERAIPWLIVWAGKRRGIKGLKTVSQREIFEMEPNVTPNAIAGVHDPNYGLVCPYKLTIALAENAVQNGATLLLNTKVTDIYVEGGRVAGVETDRGYIGADIVVNAAGVFADEIAEMAGAGGFRIHPRKGATLIFDRQITKDYVKASVAEARFFRKAQTKGGGAMPTVEGNLQLGPTAVEVEDKNDTSISAWEIEEIFRRFHYLFPNFPRDAVISAFSGVRAPTLEEDFVIEHSERAQGFINVAGIQSPGLASAPAITEMVMAFLHELGIPREKKREFIKERPAPRLFAQADLEEKARMVRENPLHGHVVCRCELVTEADVLNAIHGIIPATNIDAIKRRTRAGMGRCQGGFCGNRISAILARELGIPITSVTKDGPGSELFLGTTKT